MALSIHNSIHNSTQFDSIDVNTYNVNTEYNIKFELIIIYVDLTRITEYNFKFELSLYVNNTLLSILSPHLDFENLTNTNKFLWPW